MAMFFLPYPDPSLFAKYEVFVLTATGKPVISLFVLQMQTEI